MSLLLCRYPHSKHINYTMGVESMNTLKIRLTNDKVYVSYMGGTPFESQLNQAWLYTLNSLIFGGDIIEVSDEREKTSESLCS